MAKGRSELFVPSGAQSKYIRPLKGEYPDLATVRIPDGGHIRAENLYAGTVGLTRRHVLTDRVGDTFDYPPADDVAVAWDSTGSSKTVLIDTKHIYEISRNAFTGVYWIYDTGDVSVSGTTVTGNGTMWIGQNIQAGDIITLDANASGDGPEDAIISSVNGNAQITIEAAPSGTYGGGTDYDIKRSLASGQDGHTDWTVTDNKIVMADSSRIPYAYDPAASTFGQYDAAIAYIPKCVLYMDDRLWMANINESGTIERARIRWTTTTDRTDFASAQWIDLDYTAGEILRLVPLADFMVVYLDDNIYWGRKTNVAGSSLPKAFYSLNTGGVGLVGMKAVALWLNGHFFVGQDDIYYMSNKGLEQIGTRVVKKTIDECESPWNIYAVPDPARDRIMFGFPKDGETIEEIWSFYYKSKEWAHDEVTGGMLSNTGTSISVTWDTLSSFITTNDWDTGMAEFASWDTINVTIGADESLVSQSNRLMYVNPSGTTDFGGVAPTVVLETKDYDFDQFSRDKTATRFSLRLEEEPSAQVDFTVEGSVDRGRTWKSLGTLTVPTGDDEGFVHFRLTGSTLRFRLTSGSAVRSYIISEYTFRVRARGLETRLD